MLLARQDVMQLFGPLLDGVSHALDLYQARHRVLAENVANAETPGYRARDLEFSAALARAFEEPSDSQAAAAPAPAPEVVVDTKAAVKMDGNSVDVDTEMAKMSENALKMVALSQIIARKYAGLRSAITDGRS